jgi:hypothetical protein
MFGSPGSSPNNTVTRTIPTTIQINRPFNNVNNSSSNNNNNLASIATSGSAGATIPVNKRPTNTSLSSLGIGTGGNIS